MKKKMFCFLLALSWAAGVGNATEKPNIILVYADEISARELPIYGSTAWSQPTGGNTSDVALRAKTPVLDQLAHEHRAERDRLKQMLPQFDLHASEHDAAGLELPPIENQPAHKKANKKRNPQEKPNTPAADSEKSEGNTRFEDDFEGRSEIGENYFAARGMGNAWAVVDGVLIGKQTNDDHGAVIRKQLDFDDFDVEFDFRFSGGSRFNFVIDDKNEKSVHAGHICRVSISPKRLTISDDKTGSMNLKVRELRQSKDLTAEQTSSLAELLQRTQASKEIKLQPGQWYQLRVRIKDDIMKAHLDGVLVVKLISPGIDHPTKSQFGMTVNGATIDFDNLKVYGPVND